LHTREEPAAGVAGTARGRDQLPEALPSGTGRHARIGWTSANQIELWEKPMRLTIRTILFIAATLFSATAAPAQSARSYPWCAIYYTVDADGTPSCTFDTREQCMETVSGIGGFCVENQYYHRVTTQPRHRTRIVKLHKRTSAHLHAPAER